ncbi:MAG: ArsR/SmtB family transcription factor [Solirubrobacteraceae bacterium]
MSPKLLDSSAIELVTGRLALLADPTRVRLLALLEASEATVQQLSDQLASTPQNVSRHLGLLFRAGLVSRSREGTSVRYALADYSACRLLDQVLESLAGQFDELADLVRAS